MVDHMVIHSPWWFIIVYHHFPGFLKSDIAVLTSSPCGVDLIGIRGSRSDLHITVAHHGVVPVGMGSAIDFPYG